MTKQWLLTITLVVLGAVYYFFFFDSDIPKNIQISWRQMPPRGRSPAGAVLFNLDRPYTLSSIKVVSLAEAATNKYPHALWHMVAKDKVKPLMQVVYGHGIQGMSPYIEKTRPEPLQPGAEYRLFLEDQNKLKGQVDFQYK